MIDINNIRSGWLELQIGNRVFTVSYLTDVAKTLEKIFAGNLKSYFAKVLYFDGEGSELYLTCRKEYDDIIILWEEYTREDAITLDRFEFNYEEFHKEWLKLWNEIKDDYDKNFTFRHGDNE